MAFPLEYLDLDDIGREVRVTLSGGVELQTVITGIHAVRDTPDTLEVSVDTQDREGLVLQPGSYVFYTDEVARV